MAVAVARGASRLRRGMARPLPPRGRGGVPPLEPPRPVFTGLCNGAAVAPATVGEKRTEGNVGRGGTQRHCRGQLTLYSLGFVLVECWYRHAIWSADGTLRHQQTTPQ